MYDYLIVGSGLYGSIFAREMTNRGYRCLVIDKRNHIGGNCYTENIEGINVHKYGPHIFHTDKKNIWEYINKYIDFNNFTYRPKVNYNGNIYSFPINLMTLYQLFNVTTPEEAKIRLKKERINIENPKNFEEKALSEIGETLYKTFIYGYTKKQWNTEPKNLPDFIFKRLPIRLNFDDNYFDDPYQGIPIGGYTKIFNNLLNNIEVKLNTNYLDDIEYFNSISNKILYTGKIDELCNYKFGKLEYRSLNFKTEKIEDEYFQGCAAINYTNDNVEYTRIVEHKYFENVKTNNTIITKEYPCDYNISKNEAFYPINNENNNKIYKNEAFYPINNENNNKIYKQYKEYLLYNIKFIFGGRLAEYKYFDMDDTIESCLKLIMNIL